MSMSSYVPRPIFPSKGSRIDPRVPSELAQPPLCTTLIAPRKSGKSALVCGLIEDVYASVFDKVVIMSDTVLFDASVQQLSKTTKHKNIYFSDNVSNQSIAALVKHQRETYDTKTGSPSTLLFIDDAGDSAQRKDLNLELSKLYTKGRHIGISSIVACQSVTSQISGKMKGCTTEWIIFRNNMDDLKLLAKMLTTAYKTEAEVLKYLVAGTQEGYSFCYIDLAKSSAREVYRYCTPAEGFKDFF